jgi:type VI secretion system (T6SS) immunity protein Tdi1
MSKFGDWFLADTQGQVHWLDLIEGALSQIAQSVEEFERLMVQFDKLAEWFLLGWCNALHAAGQVPKDGQCFGFKIPPKLGAPVELSNIEVAELKPYQFWMSQIHKIPPGAVVDSFTVNGKAP